MHLLQANSGHKSSLQRDVNTSITFGVFMKIKPSASMCKAAA